MEKIDNNIGFFFLENNVEYTDKDFKSILDNAFKMLTESKRSKEILVYYRKTSGKSTGKKLVARVLRTGTYAIYDQTLWTNKETRASV